MRPPLSRDEKGKEGALGVLSSRRGWRGISRCTAPGGVQKRPVGWGTRTGSWRNKPSQVVGLTDHCRDLLLLR